MDREELKRRMSRALGTYENSMIRNISENCTTVALQYFDENHSEIRSHTDVSDELVEHFGEHYEEIIMQELTQSLIDHIVENNLFSLKEEWVSERNVSKFTLKITILNPSLE
jgi:hypothetical protein